MSLKLLEVTNSEQVELVAKLAEDIWVEHYLTILGVEQIAYMVRKFQSPQAITAQISGGYRYFIFEYGGVNVGYMGIKEDMTSLFLSKLYIEKRYRGNGIATQAVKFLEELCLKNGVDTIRLTVNKNNKDSILAYTKLGFVTVRSQTEPIGEGFVMDDFVMEHKIERKKRY